MRARVLVAGQDISSVATVEGLEIVRASGEAIATAAVRVTHLQGAAAGIRFAPAARQEWSAIEIQARDNAADVRFGGLITEVAHTARSIRLGRAQGLRLRLATR